MGELIKRLERNKKRPLLYKKDISETIKQIYLERKKTYSLFLQICLNSGKVLIVNIESLNKENNTVSNLYDITKE